MKILGHDNYLRNLRDYSSKILTDKYGEKIQGHGTMLGYEVTCVGEYYEIMSVSGIVIARIEDRNYYFHVNHYRFDHYRHYRKDCPFYKVVERSIDIYENALLEGLSLD